MKWHGAKGLLAGCMAALSVSACGSTERMHYKMTVEVDTPDGLKTGYAVREVRFSQAGNGPSLGESRPQWRINGEAVAVELPGGRTLFALLTSASNDGDYAKRIPADHMGWLSTEGMSDGPIEIWPNIPFKPHHNREKLRAAYLPMLVTFRNVADPKSVEAVEPEAFEAAFGPGVRLRRITVEQTDEPVTLGIEKQLDWLPRQRGSLDYTGSLHPDNREKDATEYAFWQGMSK